MAKDRIVNNGLTEKQNKELGKELTKQGTEFKKLMRIHAKLADKKIIKTADNPRSGYGARKAGIIRKTAAVMALITIAATGLTACDPKPEPTPTEQVIVISSISVENGKLFADGAATGALDSARIKITKGSAEVYNEVIQKSSLTSLGSGDYEWTLPALEAGTYTVYFTPVLAGVEGATKSTSYTVAEIGPISQAHATPGGLTLVQNGNAVEATLKWNVPTSVVPTKYAVQVNAESWKELNTSNITKTDGNSKFAVTLGEADGIHANSNTVKVKALAETSEIGGIFYTESTAASQTVNITVETPKTQLAAPTVSNLTQPTDYKKAIFSVAVDSNATGLKVDGITLSLSGYDANNIKLESTVTPNTYKLTFENLAAGAFSKQVTAVSTNENYTESQAAALTATVYNEPAATTQLIAPTVSNLTQTTDYKKAIFSVTVDANATGLKYNGITLPLSGYDANNIKLESTVTPNTYKLTFTNLTAGSFSESITAVSTNVNYTESTPASLTATVYSEPTSSYELTAEYIDNGNLLKVKVPSGSEWNNIVTSNGYIKLTNVYVKDTRDADHSTGSGKLQIDSTGVSIAASSFTTSSTEAAGSKVGDYVYIELGTYGDGILYNGSVSGTVGVYESNVSSAPLDSKTFSGSNTEKFATPTLTAESNIITITSSGFLPNTHAEYLSQKFTLTLNDGASSVDISVYISASGTGVKGTVNADGNIEVSFADIIAANLGITDATKTYTATITQKQPTTAKTASDTSAQVSNIGYIKNEATESLAAIANAQYNSLVGIKGLTGIEVETSAKYALLQKLDGKKVQTQDGEITIKASEIKDFDILKVYGASASDNMKDLTAPKTGATMLVNITVDTPDGDKTVLARIPFNTTSASDPGGSEDMLLRELINSATFGDIEIAYKQETFDFMNWWNIKNANTVTGQTQIEGLLFMSDKKISGSTESVEHFIFNRARYSSNVTTGYYEYRMYERKLTFNGDLYARLYASGGLMEEYDITDRPYGEMNIDEDYLLYLIPIPGAGPTDPDQTNFYNIFATSMEDYRLVIVGWKTLDPDNYKPSMGPAL